MKITVNETDMKVEGNRLIININSDLEKVLGLNKMVLSSVKPGEVVNDKYIVLEHFENGTTAVITKDLLDETKGRYILGYMDVGDSNNDWRVSNVRSCLNNDYLSDIEKEFGADSIVTHEVDLLSLDGLDDYGTSNDKVSILTIDQYRKYRKILGKNMDNWWWLATPDSTPSGWSASFVQCVHVDGSVSCNGYGCSGSVRPFFILKSSIFVSSPRD